MFFRPDLVQNMGFMESLLRMFPMSRPNDSTLLGLNFMTVPRFWSGAFPDADFAYTLNGEDGPNREGKIMRHRTLMVSRHARNALIDAGLFTHKSFLAVRSVDAPEQGIEILDQLYPGLVPMYTDKEMAELRAHEKTMFDES